ncbi:MAG TPA: polyprenol phosphomannose-dependent alpha 1,6 mannosyltransferase MptB [Pseudonocardia sp.]|jgi:alpha-1,6-mannosyltransferase
MTSQPQLSTTAADAPEAELAPAPVAPGERTTARTEPAVDTELTPAGRGLWHRLGRPPRKPLTIGFVGSLMLVVGGFGAGGVLVHDPILEGTPLVAWRFGHGFQLASMATYAGLGLVVWAWVMLGRAVLAHRVRARAVLTSALLWVLPMLVSPPLFTRDPFSYLADGALPLRGFDPYAVGPDVLTGPIPDNVHWFWHETPAPYGPLFIAAAKAVVSLTGENMIAGVVLMRLTMAVGLVLFVAALPGLTRHLGGRLPVTLWMAMANPITIVLLVGGAHNDLLVLGFLSTGTLLMLNGRHASGLALTCLAAAVKATAGLALPFLVLVWAARLEGSPKVRLTKAIAAGVAVFVVVFAACSLAGGVGIGWLNAVNAPSTITNWLSLPTGLGQALFNVANAIFGGVPQTPFIIVTRVIGVLLFLYLAVKQWLAARDGGPDAVRRAGVVLLLFALLSPATLPWYYTWGMSLLVAAAWSKRGMQVVIFASVFLIIGAFPNGEVSLYAFGFMILGMAGALLAAVSLSSPDPLRLRSPRRRPAPDG